MDARVAGLLLVGGAVVFFGPGLGMLPFRQGSRFEKRWTGGLFATAVVFTALGFLYLARAFEGTPGEPWGQAAMLVYGLAAPLMLAAMLYYGTVGAALPGADPATQARRTPLEAALAGWADAMVSCHTLMALGAVTLAGLGLVFAAITPAWMGWFSVGFGAVLLLLYPLKLVRDTWVADVPVWAHVWALVVGVPLLWA